MNVHLLVALRKALGITQAEISARIPRADGAGTIDDTLLARIEREQIGLPRGFEWDYLRAVLGVLEDRADDTDHADGGEHGLLLDDRQGESPPGAAPVPPRPRLLRAIR